MKKIFMGMILCLATSLAFGVYSVKYPDEDEVEYSESVEMSTEATDIPETRGPSWVAYQGNKIHVSNFYEYDPLIFFPGNHPIIAPLLVKGKTLLAYVSMSDTEQNDFFYNEVKKANLFIGKNPADEKRSCIDIRDPRWEELLLGTIIPAVLTEGFNGFCFCNIDAAINLEHQDPITYKGMTKAAISLLAKVKELYGDFKIMIDMRGILHIGNELLPFADMLFYESLYTQKIGKKVVLQKAQNFELTAQQLQALAQKKDGLPVYTLDFWPEKDKETVRTIYEKERSYQFVPYVADNLKKISPEPAREKDERKG